MLVHGEVIWNDGTLLAETTLEMLARPVEA